MAYVMAVHAEKRDQQGRYCSLGETELLSDTGTPSWFAFFAGVRNEHNLEPIAPMRELPDDVSEQVRLAYEGLAECGDIVAMSWLSIDELLGFDYDAPLRFQGSGPGPRLKADTYRALFGDQIFDEANQLKALGADRIVYWIH
ncbi:hypothetical protein [Lysobacter enzymogenes]|uniref:hypothetical protein n=1 Tax=Lysobacter enzymogenes TaxID=69 RepID=UPI00089C3E09|nr:hypothetical protein [Lysobacter enzymogenes]SDW14159.1 hypothetical protein SAMN05421681_101225 [Lysobacter enzymogenes]